MRKGAGAYLAGVTVVLRLLALVALTLMPFGMGLGTAVAAEPAHSAMSTVEKGHCESPADQGKAKPIMGLHCGGACTALPADLPNVAAAVASVQPLLLAGSVQVFSGTIPPPATPPPKRG